MESAESLVENIYDGIRGVQPRDDKRVMQGTLVIAGLRSHY
jgi:hypothetical protein